MAIYPHYNSKYERWYYNIIETAQSQSRFKGNGVYYESHHIVPRSLGGNDDRDNIVLLTGREHFICHWLLYKFCDGDDKRKMSYAWLMMCNISNDKQERHTTNSRVYEFARRSRKITGVSEETRKRQSLSQLGKTIPEDTRRRISETSKGRVKTETHRKNLSESLRGYKKSEDHIMKIAESRTGHRWTDDQKSRLKEIRPVDGENNPSFGGWYITPWGIFSTPRSASESAPFTITENALRKYCKYRNSVTITNNHPIKREYVGKTPCELGFGFLPKVGG
jgi:hypothetical protein